MWGVVSGKWNGTFDFSSRPDQRKVGETKMERVRSNCCLLISFPAPHLMPTAHRATTQDWLMSASGVLVPEDKDIADSKAFWRINPGRPGKKGELNMLCSFLPSSLGRGSMSTLSTRHTERPTTIIMETQHTHVQHLSCYYINIG